MGKPKKRTSPRRTGARRSHLVLELARKVNAKSPIKAFTTRRESGKKLSTEVKAKTVAEPKAPAKATAAPKKAVAKKAAPKTAAKKAA
jgi:ribosomal protein L32